MEIRDRRFVELSTTELLAIVSLRIDVFIVEQDCAYPELDGRDDEPTTRHLWLDDEGAIVTDVRLLDEGNVRRIGRLATRPDTRGRGLAARLVDHALAHSDRPWILDAQSHLRDWYAVRGFVVDGEEFLEDGIPHLPMRRDA